MINSLINSFFSLKIFFLKKIDKKIQDIKDSTKVIKNNHYGFKEKCF